MSQICPEYALLYDLNTFSSESTYSMSIQMFIFERETLMATHQEAAGFMKAFGRLVHGQGEG
jgi:hypothetical protein